MKRIIDGKTYNSDTATRIAGYDGEETADLYLARHGRYFLVINHFIESKITSVPSYMTATLIPFTNQQAQNFIDEYAPFTAPVPPVDDITERRLTIRLPRVLADQLEAQAKGQGLSLNAYLMRCFERVTT